MVSPLIINASPHIHFVMDRGLIVDLSIICTFCVFKIGKLFSITDAEVASRTILWIVLPNFWGNRNLHFGDAFHTVRCRYHSNVTSVLFYRIRYRTTSEFSIPLKYILYK